MQLSNKDKSLLLLIASALVVLWIIFTLFSRLALFTNFKNSDIAKLVSKPQQEWLNVSRPLELDDFKDRIILLDFWTYSCVSCIKSLPEIKKLEDRFGSKLLVIGVHSARFNGDTNLSKVRKSILKHHIDFPVINDPELKIWKGFEIKSWPSFVLINPRGKRSNIYSGTDKFEKIKIDIKKLLSKYKTKISRDPLPMLLERYNTFGNVLTFPTKIEYASKFSYKTRRIPALFIANSGQNNIIVSSLTGKIIVKIGSGKSGFSDGDFESAAFSNPGGLLFRNNKLYVADSGNNALRVVDFKKKNVTTLLRSMPSEQLVDSTSKSKEINLSYPTDLEFFPDKNTIAIANAGTNQILSYDLKDESLLILAGNGLEGIKDGKYPKNQLSQTSDLEVFKGKLYFVDTLTSSLRTLDKKGRVTTLAGKSFDLQHPLGLTVDNTGAYVVDSYNSKVRKFDFSSKKLRSLNIKNNQLDEPEGIVAVRDNFYVVDSNNNRIISINRASLKGEVFNIMPPLQLPKEGFLEYLPNLETLKEVEVKSNSEISLKIIPNEGWKLNEDGPSFINLLELTGEAKADLVASFDWSAVKKKDLKLPKMSARGDYLIQGTIYYCEDKKNALCYIHSYEQKIITKSSGTTKMKIILGDMDDRQ